MDAPGTRSAAVRPRARADRRQRILDAAFTTFAREGYAQATVDAIASAAGVAKHTIYSHFGDKQTLLRETIAAESDLALARNLAALELLRDVAADTGPADMPAVLRSVARRFLDCYCDVRAHAVRRLLYAEAVQFPDLIDIIQGRATDPVTEALADRLARLSLAGRLHTPDPASAAEQFAALLTGSMQSRSRLGTRHVPDDELHAVATAAVELFLTAYGPAIT
ncbi:TetR/AcrR family transcriptional regulator [Frankia sp. Ag45/Mut15]|uniref:TetR/AcrR family transcriptional regulator n=1 Tax=Frankia umida TaxID=573489 RepID=A0ABT0K530_9ACTN|nr:TetR/AcrR family transcriptional regulator [Frankia umida]MCK9878890.1 TetR/AcrR family transcriptional regulator [Frankia umida]